MALGVALALSTLLFPSASAIGDQSACPHGANQAVKAGIVTATACWTQATVGGATIDTATLADNPGGIDLNGFEITGDPANAVQINESTRAVTSVQLSSGNAVSVQLNSRNWPTAGQVQALGSPFVISFIAPLNGSMQLTDVRLGSNQVAGALAGLSPVGTVDTPVMLEPGGGGSMDLNVALAGIFTLKGIPQSVTIALPTKPNEGTKLDGFELSLAEITGLRFIAIYDLELKYSASQKLFSGTATLGFPFFGEGTGVGANLTIQNGVVTDLGVNLTGVDIPIAAVGAIYAMRGGFHVSGEVATNFDGYCKSIGYDGGVIVGGTTGFNAYTHWYCQKGSTTAGIDVTAACKWQTGNPAATAFYADPNNANSWTCTGASPVGATSLDLGGTVGVSAIFGPQLPIPFSKTPIAPLAADADLAVNYRGSELVVDVRGKFYLFNIPVGSAYLTLHSNSGVEFGAHVGIGVPSFTDDTTQPFYLGLGVSGWFSRAKFQLEGDGTFRLFGLDVLKGNGLINDQGLGACWTVLGVAGGAFYKYGADAPEAFRADTCGLGQYREQFPGGTAATAATARMFRVTQGKTVLAVRGIGAAPRFALRSAGGRLVRVPTAGSSAMAADYAVVLDRFTDTTYVVLPHARGTWTISPYSGSATVTSVKTVGMTPNERVTGKVVGSGTTRTLVYHAPRLPNTRLLFLEVLPDGTQFPILNTAAGSGSRRFRLETGSGYGTRKLRVVVLQGGSPAAGSRVLSRYRVHPPALLRAAAYVSATRDGFAVYAEWTRVRGARGYLVQVYTSQHGRLVASLVRRVSARTTSIDIPSYPATPGRSVARVRALNSDGVPGRPTSTSFFTTSAALTLKAAAKLSVEKSFQRRGAVDMITQCPAGRQGYCQVRLALFLKGRAIVTRAYQQAPGTMLRVRLQPTNPALKRALARALNKPRGRVRTTCRIFRLANGGSAEASRTT